MIVCVCKNISERDIARAVAKGCPSFSALQKELAVSTCCGSCECAARESFAEHREAQTATPVAA